jgi:ADP-ribose pyrophosphatase
MNEMNSRLLSSETIYRGRVFAVTVDAVAYPDGRRVSMEAVRHRGSVVLLPMPAPDRIILIRQYRYVVNEWLWELPAGSLEPEESPEAAAMRECHEEVGMIAARARRLGTFYPSPGFCDEAMHFFLLTELRDRRPGEPAPARDPDEVLTVKEFSLTDAKELVRNGEIVDMKTMVGLTLLTPEAEREK